MNTSDCIRSVLVLLALPASVLLGACEAEVDEVPEVAEVEEPVFEEGIELDEEIVLTEGDEGERVMVTGWVSGVPLDTGFFLRTEGDRLVFVEGEAVVGAGDVVRAVGTLRSVEIAIFEGWEIEAFEGDLDSAWQVLRSWVVEADSVTPVDVDGGDG